MLVNSKKILIEAVKNNYAVPHFNFHNLENARAIMEAAHELKSPLVLAVTPGTLKFSGIHNVVGMVKGLCKTYPDIPVALHMDHHHDYDAIEAGIKAGFTSVMIDLSQKTLEENIAGTKKVVALARKYGVTVEAEVGSVPGIEDDLIVEEKILSDPYTKPESVMHFVNETQVDSIAVAIGTVHGLYKTKPHLNFERIKELKKITDIPLVLHGASGLSKEDLQKCVESGINKVNIATELKEPFLRGIIDHYKKFDPNNLFDHNLNDPRNLFKQAVENVKQVVKEKIKICKADNRY